MKKSSSSESGAFNPRIFAAFLLCAAGGMLAMLSFASTPSTGTVSPTNATLTYDAGPFTTPNQSPLGLGQLDSGPRCNSNFPCDSFKLTVSVPAGYMATHPQASVRVTMFWTDLGTGQSDYDLYIYKGDVANLSGSQQADYQAASGANPEVASVSPLVDGDSVYTLKIVPYTPTHETVHVRVEFLTGASGGSSGFPGFGDADPTVAGAPRYQNFYAPHGSTAETGNGEFNIGFNAGTKRIMLMNSGPIWRLTTPENFSPAKPECCEALWEDVTNLTTITGLDPILWTTSPFNLLTGQLTARTLASNSTVGTNGVYGYSDDDGDTWNPVSASPPNASSDHETIGSGPFPASLSALANPTNHGIAVYYCAQTFPVGAAACQRSDTLGTSYNPSTLPYTGNIGDPCRGIHGHVKVGPDGTVYLPVRDCSGNAGLVVSLDGGTTWVENIVPNTATQTHGSDPSVAIGANNTIYFSYVRNEPVGPQDPKQGHMHVQVGSKDSTGHITWTNDRDLGISHGVINAVFPEAVAGDDDRAAVGFLGTDQPGDYEGASFPGIWYLFIGTTYDSGNTWTVVNATPNDPVQGVGGIWQGGGSNQNRNLLDFNEVTMDSKGRVLFGYDDGCVDDCVTNPANNSYTANMRVARQSGGKTLFARFDPLEPAVPKAPCLSGTRDTTGARLTWKVPDNSGADIAAYRIFRGTSPGGETLIATTSPVKPEYVDTTADPSVTHYFYKVSAVNSVNTSNPNSDNISNEIDLTVVAPPPPQDPCAAPGVTLLTDATGDSLSPGAGTDMISASVSQPYAADGNVKLIFTIKTDPDPNFTAAKTPGAAWYLAMKVPDATQSSGFRYAGVRMDASPTGPIFSSYVPGTNTSGGTDGRFVDSSKPADPASSYDPNTGTITIIVPASDLGLADGSVIRGFVAGSTQSSDVANVGAGATEVWDAMPDSLAFAGSYTINNQTCRPNTAPTAALTATPTSGFAPLTVNFSGAGSSDPDTAPPADTIASYTFTFGDGTSTTQTTATVQHQYANPGTYTASLTVTDSRGKSSTNSATQTITVNGRPDLVVSALTSNPAQPKHGTTATLTATVKNQGNANAGASQTQFFDGTTSLGIVNTGGLVPGQSVQVSLRWAAPNKKGSRTIRAMADRANTVAESNENNNSTSITVNVQ
jgi:Uncharacterized conserved protein